MAKERSGKRANDLRKRAEKILAADPQAIRTMGPADIQKLIYELNVHQIELEMQNEQIRQNQLELQETRDKYLNLYDLAPIGYFTLDHNSLIVDVNITGRELLGSEKDSLIGTQFTAYISPDSQDAFYLHLREVLKTGIKGNCELMMLKADGAPFPTKLISIADPEKDRNINYCITAVIDITKHKQAEESLKKSIINLSSIIESNIDGMVIVNKQGVIHFVNSATESILGRKSSELVGSLLGFTLVEDKSTELEVIRPDKTRLVVEVRIGKTDWEGEDMSLLSLRDITERKKMQEELIVSDRLASIGALVAGVAHEINNPLTGVIGFSNLLLDRKDLPDDIKEDLNTIDSEAKRAAQIVKNLLTFARKPPTGSEAVNIHRLIENTLALCIHQLKLNNIEVNTKFASDLPEVIINSSELQQVFMNLIINAEFSMIEAHKKGTFTIVTECAGPIVKVSFTDDGPGISRGNLDHLFDPFFTTKEIGKGTGLGLSICYGIISEAGGSIYAESQLGKGATFIVELPAVTPSIGGTKYENS
ncbi:PAS domain S-box protein [Chloroflexota bacterium]